MEEIYSTHFPAMFKKYATDANGVQMQPPQLFYKKVFLEDSRKNTCVGVSLGSNFFKYVRTFFATKHLMVKKQKRDFHTGFFPEGLPNF